MIDNVNRMVKYEDIYDENECGLYRLVDKYNEYNRRE